MRTFSLITAVAALTASPALAAPTESELDRCLEQQQLLRIARIVDDSGLVFYGRVSKQTDGMIRSVVPIAPNATPLAAVFDAAEKIRDQYEGAVEPAAVCAPVPVSEAQLDSERRIILSTGLNYAAHAEEAGGGDVFLFPKPSAPTSPYATVHAPAGVTLLDYEVELAFALFDDVDPFNPPSRDRLLERTAFFLTNDVSAREAIIRRASIAGPGTGFPEGKGQPGFLPAGPWMIRGSELFDALDACGASGLGLRLWVDDETTARQDSNTGLMILQAPALIARIGTWIQEHGRLSSMPFTRPGQGPRLYPLATPEDLPQLPAGSIVQTGTPDGVALHAPSPLAVTLRGALRLRSPFQQFLVEEKERVASGGTKYLVPGNVVHARIDGLGRQRFAIGEAGEEGARDPCLDPTSPKRLQKGN